MTNTEENEEPGNLWIKEVFVNEDKGWQFGDSNWYETFTDDIGDLFKSLQKEYGKAGKMFVDRDGLPPLQTGWVFSSTAKYEDTGEPYKRSVWVSVSKTKPVREVKTVGIKSPWEG